jgi:hypothetical protein
MLVQPGMSHYWLIDPHLHAEVDAELYGQTPDGKTLPGHEPHAPHDHPASQGIVVSDPLLLNLFGPEFYQTLLAPARSLALGDRCLNLAVFATSIALAPPDQPPRG